MLRRFKAIWQKIRGKTPSKKKEESLHAKKETLYAVGLIVVEEYIKSRKFRRQLKDTKLQKMIHKVIEEWSLKGQK